MKAGGADALTEACNFERGDEADGNAWRDSLSQYRSRDSSVVVTSGVASRAVHTMKMASTLEQTAQQLRPEVLVLRSTLRCQTGLQKTVQAISNLAGPRKRKEALDLPDVPGPGRPTEVADNV